MRVGSASHAHVERLTCVSRGLTRIFSGLRASSTRGLAPLCPDRRPPRPRQPIVGVFRRGGLHFGRHATSNRDLTASKRGNCSNRATTRRRHAGRMLLMVQNPHHYPWRHAPSQASCSLTSAGQPGGAPINADRASPTEPGQGSSATALVADEAMRPDREESIPTDRAQCSLTGRMLSIGCNPPDGIHPVYGAAARARQPDAPSLNDARDRAPTNTLCPISTSSSPIRVIVTEPPRGRTAALWTRKYPRGSLRILRLLHG